MEKIGRTIPSKLDKMVHKLFIVLTSLRGFRVNDWRLNKTSLKSPGV